MIINLPLNNINPLIIKDQITASITASHFVHSFSVSQTVSGPVPVSSFRLFIDSRTAIGCKGSMLMWPVKCLCEGHIQNMDR